MNFFCVHKRELEDISQHNAESSTALALCTAFAGTAVGILSNFANTSVKDMSVFGDAFLFVGVPILLLLTLVYGLRSWSKYKKKNAIIKYIEDECK